MNSLNESLFSKIVDLLQSARHQVVRSVNQTMVLTYFEIGKKIVEEEQNGKERAEYGEKVIKELSKLLTKEFGKGFSERNIEQMRQFYLVYSKPQTVSAEFQDKKPQTLFAVLNAEKLMKGSATECNILSWSHYLKLMRIDDQNERSFYEIESAKNNWSVRELQRQFDSALYLRLALSRDKDKIRELSEIGHVLEQPKDAIKDPYILEFIGLPEN